MLIVDNIGELVTMEGPRAPRRGSLQGVVSVVKNAFLAAKDGKVLAVGPREELPALLAALEQSREQNREENGEESREETTVLDAGGRAVVPGFVDAHTHLVFAGWRYQEYVMRCQGATYQEILRAGGGILETVRQTRQATEEALFQRALSFLDEMLSLGTTSVEAKSGYGLDTENELKQLRVIRRLKAEHCLDVVPTFLPAHAIPPEYSKDREGYIQEIIGSMLPLVRREGLARFLDVFCDEGAFTSKEARRILVRGKELGYEIKLHADELRNTQGAELGASLGAVSVDHLCMISQEGVRALRESDTVAVLLPATSCFMGKDHGKLGRKLVDAGIPVALGTDFNPGTSPATSIPLCMTLACSLSGLTPAEALVAATWNAAWAIGLGGRVGGLQPGMQADALILDADSYVEIPYRFGANLVWKVLKKGKVVFQANKGRMVRGSESQRPACAGPAQGVGNGKGI